MKTLFIDSDGQIIADPAAQGYIQESTHSEGFLTKEGSDDYCDAIRQFSVRSTAVDGRRAPKLFKDPVKLLAYVAQEFPEDGGISTDGIVRLDDICYQLSKGGNFYSVPSRAALRAAVAA